MNQECTVYIERLGINGEGVGYTDGFTLFVDEALPGEEVLVRLYERRKTFGRAKIVKRLTSSPHRVEPPCPYFGRCGGCQLMHLEYAEQLKSKQQRVLDALKRIGKFSAVEVLPCIASPLPLGYRNKIQLPVSAQQRLGLYARNTHEIIAIERCHIHSDLGEKAFHHLQRIIPDFCAPDELKHLLIKTALHTDQILVILVTATDRRLTTLAEEIMKAIPEVKGVVQNINASLGNKVLGGTFHTLAGEGWIEEKLCGLYFKISPASFFQVNPLQAENLYQKVIEFADVRNNERVLDAYCGVGTLSLIMAQYAREVIGVECVADAIEDARKNGERNQISNVRFICAQAEECIATLEDIDVAILNPPRKGCDPALIQRLLILKPKRIVYVSCDPATLARDLQLLCSQGYKLDAVQPFDMFPQTAHVECVVSLSIPHVIQEGRRG